MKAYQNQDRFKTNVRFFAKRDPVLARAVEMVRPTTRLVMDDAGAFNIDVGGGPLYPSGAKVSAEIQVEAYLGNSFRFYVNPSEVYASCVALNGFFHQMKARMEGFAKATVRAPYGGFLVVFGIGLGFHVKTLADELDFTHLIVVEPHDEFIAHSFHVTDWAGLAQSLARKGRSLTIVRGADAFSNIIAIMRDHDYPLLDGSYYYFHYQTPEFSALGQRLLVGCQDLAMVAGWVEDQLLMLRNNHGNFAKSDFYIQKAPVRSVRARPAVVVGAGPSLDSCLDDIKRIRDQVVLISASSGLRVLLDNGMTPDIHCELENIPILVDVAQGLAARHDLSGIVLYASSTVDPGVPPHYRDAVYYFRANLASAEFYARGAESTKFSEPTSGNTAVYCAVSLGFREIYLFGLDFGSKVEGRQHSKHSIYGSEEGGKLLPTTMPYEFDRTAPGNFGGQVQTSWMLDWGRNSAAKVIHGVPGIRVFNCSDGAMIQGAIPQDPSAIEPASATVSAAEDVAQALAGLDHAQASRADPEGFARLGQSMRDFLSHATQVWSARLEGASPQAAILVPVRRTIADMAALEASQRAAFGTLLGHVQTMLSNAFHYASTLADTDAEAGLAAIQAGMVQGFADLSPLIDELFGKEVAHDG